MISAGICDTRPSPTDSLVKTSEAADEAEPVPRDADDDAAEDVDRQDDQAGDGVAADEFRRAVHRAEEGALLLEFATALLGDFLVDQPRRQVGVDRHLLAGDCVEGEARADLGDAGRALGDDQEVDGDEDEEDDDADDEVAAHHQAGEAADDVAGGGDPLGAVGEDQARSRDVERQSEDRRDQQHGRKGGEFERLVDPQGDHQDQHRQGDRHRQAEVDHRRRNGQEEQAQDQNDADREGDVFASAAYCRRARRRRQRHSGLSPTLRRRPCPAKLAWVSPARRFSRARAPERQVTARSRARFARRRFR